MAQPLKGSRHLEGDSYVEYRVFPDPPEPITITKASGKSVYPPFWPYWLYDKPGCAIWFIMWIICGGALSSVWASDASLLGGLILSFAISAIAVLIYRSLDARRNAKWEAKEARKAAGQALLAKVAEAESLTSRLLVVRQSSVGLAARMPELLDNAAAWLQRAKYEFNDHAFGPFWEAVLESAVCLAQFCDNAKELASNASFYNGALRGRQHTFPSFPVHPMELPNPMPIANDLRSIVRRGQTNFQFAIIWEQYKTRQVLVSGFKTLEEAISGLTDAVGDVSDLLKKALSI